MKVTLCGSTRFVDAFSEWNRKLTLAGHVVYALSMHGRQESDTGKPHNLRVVTEEEKIILDLAHLAKIDASDAIMVLNVGGYIGESTRREITWARMRDKRVYWLEAKPLGHAVEGYGVQHFRSLITGKPIHV